MNDNLGVPRLRLTRQEDITQLIPYLVGFTPEESLVIAVMDHGRLAVTARVDLADVQLPGQAERLLDRIWTRFPGADAHLVAYTASQPAGWALLDRCAAHLPARSTVQRTLVDGDTWHLPNGRTGAIDHYGPIATEASFHGLRRLASRSELIPAFASPPDTDELIRQAEAALSDLPQPSDTDAIITRMGDLLRRHLPITPDGSPDRLDVQDAVQLAVLAQHLKAREVAELALIRQDATQHLSLWRSVVNSVPESVAEAPLYLAGMAAWAAGEGASASIALEQTQHVGEPGPYPPAVLLDELIDQVIPPSAWDTFRADGLAQTDPRIREAVLGINTPKAWESLPQRTLQHRPQPPDLAPPAPGIAI
ncbi:MAG: DUF4192 domain-containing protein [Propionibacteriaceae bacterium]|nr:DUF4192 domain-containing protein [Propionibacteriaceae bacterium]